VWPSGLIELYKAFYFPHLHSGTCLSLDPQAILFAYFYTKQQKDKSSEKLQYPLNSIHTLFLATHTFTLIGPWFTFGNYLCEWGNWCCKYFTVPYCDLITTTVSIWVSLNTIPQTLLAIYLNNRILFCLT
jgi:hypothetical protein